MTATRKIIRAFLASPGDLAKERQAIKDAATEFNDTWANKLGCQVELLGWDDTISGYGRPQHLINQEVDRCDLFIGMMWKKWGTPPDINGTYTSGFHEEFDRSIKRREESGKPEICLFFKKIPEDYLDDRGPDLKRVLEFRDRIVSEKSVLFQEFASIREIEKLIRKSFSRYVTQINEDELSESYENLEKQKEEQSNEKSANHDINVSSPLSPEGFSFLQNFVVKVREHDALDNLSASDIARFRLLANSISQKGNHDTQLGVHDINILFANRDNFVFGDIEVLSLMRFGFRSLEYENTPFWLWYSKYRSVLDNVAVVYSCLGQNDNEKAGAIRVLTLLGMTLTDNAPFNRELITKSWFSGKSSSKVRNAALEHFKVNGDLKDLDIVKTEYDRNDYNTSRKALESMITILHRNGEHRAAQTIVLETQFSTLDERILNDVLGSYSKLEQEKVISGLEHQHPKVRLWSLRVLKERSGLSTEIVEKFTKDTDANIRYEALSILVERGRNFSDEEAREILAKPREHYGSGMIGALKRVGEEGKSYFERFVFDRLCELSESQLIKLDNEALPYDDAPYFALTDKYFSKYAGVLRANVDNHFKDYFDKRVEHIRSLENTTRMKNLVDKIKNLEDPAREKLTRNGLDILCRQGESKDIDRIRENLSTGYAGASISDAEYFRKNGDWSDIELLANAKTMSAGETFIEGDTERSFQDAVARAVYKMGMNSISDLFSINLPPGILKRILETCSETAFRKISDAALFRLLNNKDENVRKTASMLCVRAFTKRRLKTILDEYVSGHAYRYYNVIHWLDLGVSMSRAESKKVVLNARR